MNLAFEGGKSWSNQFFALFAKTSVSFFQALGMSMLNYFDHFFILLHSVVHVFFFFSKALPCLAVSCGESQQMKPGPFGPMQAL